MQHHAAAAVSAAAACLFPLLPFLRQDEQLSNVDSLVTRLRRQQRASEYSNNLQQATASPNRYVAVQLAVCSQTEDVKALLLSSGSACAILGTASCADQTFVVYCLTSLHVLPAGTRFPPRVASVLPHLPQ
jgi:hypothetical protein